MSETVKTQSKYQDLEALSRAVVAMGGQVIGMGSHHISGTTEDGFGFNLPGWTKPLVAKGDMTLAYDDYNGHWGNVADLVLLEERYVIQKTLMYCEQQGLSAEQQLDGSVLIYYPDGTVSVTPQGLIDANGFSGSACSLATRPLAEALGTVTSETRKESYTERIVELGQE